MHEGFSHAQPAPTGPFNIFTKVGVMCDDAFLYILLPCYLLLPVVIVTWYCCLFSDVSYLHQGSCDV